MAAILRNLWHIFYPELCVYCDAQFSKGEKLLCTRCKAELPVTNYHDLNENPLLDKFIGGLPIRNAYTFLSFQKMNITQQLIHKLKYENQQQIGWMLGRWFGEYINENLQNQGVDLVIPVPLHKSRYKQRGYNQSEIIAKGVSGATRIKCDPTIIRRKHQSSSQTRKSRLDRLINVQKVFAVSNAKAIKDKHILLLDDVVTTGATLDACGNLLLKHGAQGISVAALAVA